MYESQSNPVQQGAVVRNCHRSFRDYSRRKATNTGLYQRPASEHIRLGDPCFYSQYVDDRSANFGNGIPVYASFNGIEAESRKQLAEELSFAGTAVNNVPFNERTSTDDPMTLQCGGQITMTNTGKDRLNVGDVVLLSPPKTDLSNCAILPAMMGPRHDQKIRPVTKRFKFKVDRQIRRTLTTPVKGATLDESMSVKDGGRNPMVAHTVEDAQKNPSSATWMAIKTTAAVFASMQPFVLKLVDDMVVRIRYHGVAGDHAVSHDYVKQLINGFMLNKRVSTTAAHSGQYTSNDAHVNFANVVGQFCSLMLGMPWTMDMKSRFNGDEYDFESVRDMTIKEFARRMTADSSDSNATAYGTAGTGDIRTNPFNLRVKADRKRPAAHPGNWTEPRFDVASAIAVAESYPVMVTMEGETALAKKNRRVCGEVLRGGEPGGAMDVLLRGTKLAGTF
jgi:hypothetical protein